MRGNRWDWIGLQTGVGQATTGGDYWQRHSLRNSSKVFSDLIESVIDRLAPCPWSFSSGPIRQPHVACAKPHKPLYDEAQRQRRDSSPWTTVQGILAPLQFLVFLVSLALVLNYLMTGSGYTSAAVSVVVKTVVLYTIMITGAIWEKAVFGKYLFADAFFWEDTVSMLVIALHTTYLVAMLTGWGTPDSRMLIALAAYASYTVNAAQFLLKLRAARLETPNRLARSAAR